MAPRLLRTLAAHWAGSALVGAVVVLSGALVTLVQLRADAGAPVLPNLVVALVLGLLAGTGYAVLRVMLEGRRRTPDSVGHRFGVPVVGVVPSSDRLGHTASPGAARDSNSEHGDTAGDAFRALRTALDPGGAGRARILVVTSPEPRDGRSTVAAHLAIATALAGQRVVLVDADLRQPTIAARFGLVEGVGLTDVLAGRVDLADVLQPTAVHDALQVLAGGSVTTHPRELLGSDAMRVLLAELAREVCVVLDAPPVLPAPGTAQASTGAADLAALADGALVVLSAGDTRDRELDSALQHLRACGGRPLGIVVNRVGRRGPVYRPGT